MTREEVLDRIKQLIADQNGCRVERMPLETRLQTDIGMAGDDGFEFLHCFQNKFGVDMSSIRHDAHFDPEGFPVAAGLVYSVGLAIIVALSLAWPWLIPIWLAALFFSFRHQSRTERPGEIRVSDLLRSVEMRCWTYDYAAGVARTVG
jgi:hypothetical protein